jgi:HK97 family phage major capsid protein
MGYAKRERQELARVIYQMNSAVQRAEEGSGRINREAWSKLVREHDRLEAQIDKIEAPLRALNRPGAQVEEFATFSSTPFNSAAMENLRARYPRRPGEYADDSDYGRAFSNYVRVGMDGLDADQKDLMRQNFIGGSGLNGPIMNAQSTTPGSAGGYIIPTGFSGMLEKAMRWFGGIAGVCDQFETATGNPWPWPTVDDTMNRGRIIGQNIQLPETDVVFGQVTFNAYIGTSDLVLIPLALMEDSYFNMDGLLADLLGERFGRLYNWKCTLGSGISEPTGIVTAAAAAGNLLQFPSGQTTSINYNNLVDLEHSVDPAYRYNPSSYWMFSDSMLKTIKKLIDGNGRPLWQPGLSASFELGAAPQLMTGSRPTILDHPYILNQDISPPVAGAYSILFGDMSRFKVRKVGEGFSLMRLVERYADYLQIGFVGWGRFDSNLISPAFSRQPIVIGQQSTT